MYKMHTWKDKILSALFDNGELWCDIEFTPFSEEELKMSTKECDFDCYHPGYSVVAFTRDFVYRYEYSGGWQTIFPTPRHPAVWLKNRG